MFKVGDKTRINTQCGNPDWHGVECVITDIRDPRSGYVFVKVTKLTPALEEQGYRVGGAVGLATYYMERCNGLLDI